MTASTLITAPAAALLALLAVRRPTEPHLRDDARTAACSGVEGSIEGRAARLGLDLHGFKATGRGSISGGFQGDLRLEVRREGRHGPDTELTILLTATTATGPLRMQGTAFAARERPEDAFHRARGWLDVSDGSAGALGRVQVEGTADTSTRVIAIRYRGELCGAPGVELAARADGSGR